MSVLRPHGRGKQPETHAQNEPGANPDRRATRERSRWRIAGHSFSYSLDINFHVVSGVICKRPNVAVVNNGQRCVWSRIKNVDQGHRRRGLYLPIRFEGDLAKWAFANIDLDDQVCVVGRMWTGSSTKNGVLVHWPWLQVERATCGMPVQLDSDPRFLRVRVDHWNALCAKAGGETVDLRVPDPDRRTVKFDDQDPYHVAEDVESLPDEDPDA